MTGDDDTPDAPSEFERAMRDVRRLRNRDAPRPPEAPPRTPPIPAPRNDPEAPVAFDVERSAERIAGRAPGIDARQLRRLRRGEIAPERRVDLHGLDVPAAERALRETFAAALAAGERCVLVVHGRGLHSAGRGPVLREAFLAWLPRPPVGLHVLAFATAPPRHGGPGATLVLLRRQRDPHRAGPPR